MTKEKMTERICKLVNTVTELGGTVYDVAEDAGLISANDFLKLHFEGEEEKFRRNVQLVTEVYVKAKIHNKEVLERVFLCAEDELLDLHLLNAGTVTEGKFIIDYENLKILAPKGYQCLYHRREDGHNGTSFTLFYSAFKDNRKMFPFKMWEPDQIFIGNGFNRALLVETDFESAFVMPDIHMVREALRVFRAENLIQDVYQNNFQIERIDMEDFKVYETLRNDREDISGMGRVPDDEQLPESYRRLFYQKAYIKTYYPEEYEEIWNREKKIEKSKTRAKNERVSLGICFAGCEAYGVCQMADGTIRRIPQLECLAETPLNLSYGFKLAGGDEDVAPIMKKIIFAAESVYKVMVEKVYVTVAGEEQKNSDRLEVMKNVLATKQGELPQIEYVDYVTAIMKVYEKEVAVSQMKENEIALIYDFGNEYLYLGLVKKEENGRYHLLQCIYEEDREKFYNPDLQEAVKNDVEHFMLNTHLRPLGIACDRGMTKAALERVRNSYLRMKRQLLRSDSAIILFQCWLSITDDYPIERLETCFFKILKRNDRLLNELLESAGISVNDISMIVLAGEESNYPFVGKHITEVTGKDVVTVGAPESVAARGAVL